MSWPCPQYWSHTWCWPLPLVLTMYPVLVSHLVLATPAGVHHLSWHWSRPLYWSHTWFWLLPLVTTCPGIDHVLSFDLLLLSRKLHPRRQSEQTAQHGFAIYLFIWHHVCRRYITPSIQISSLQTSISLLHFFYIMALLWLFSTLQATQAMDSPVRISTSVKQTTADVPLHRVWTASTPWDLADVELVLQVLTDWGCLLACLKLKADAWVTFLAGWLMNWWSATWFETSVRWLVDWDVWHTFW